MMDKKSDTLGLKKGKEKTSLWDLIVNEKYNGAKG